MVPTPIVGKFVCIPVGPVGPVGAEGMLLGGIRPMLLGTLPSLPSFPREVGISFANFPVIKHHVKMSMPQNVPHQI